METGSTCSVCCVSAVEWRNEPPNASKQSSSIVKRLTRHVCTIDNCPQVEAGAASVSGLQTAATASQWIAGKWTTPTLHPSPLCVINGHFVQAAYCVTMHHVLHSSVLCNNAYGSGSFGFRRKITLITIISFGVDFGWL